MKREPPAAEARARAAKDIVPFAVRVFCHRLRRRAEWWLRPLPWATRRGDIADFSCVIDSRSSPLHRPTPGAAPAARDGKKTNVALGAAAVDRIVVSPGEVFSFCRTVGPTTRRRGFAPGLEMHDRKFTQSPGGGLCQLSNLLFALAVYSDAEIVERHRHSFDLFPDVDRTVPFGFGATVFYNYVDLQFRNTLDRAIMIRAWLDDGSLRGEIRCPRPAGWRIRVEETDHRFFREGGSIMRENKLWRRKTAPDGTEESAVFLLSNRAKVLYPADHLVTPL